MNIKKRIYSLVFLINILFPSMVSADTIKIGITGPFSGPYVAAGDQQWQGASQAVEDINKTGGINGNKLVLVSADDACIPQKAENIAKKFVLSHEIKAVIGHNCSSTTLAASKIYARANMLMITPASTAQAITEQNYPSIFRTCGRDDTQGEVAADFMNTVLHAKKVIILYESSVYGEGIAKSVKIALEKLGISPIFYEKISNNQEKNDVLVKNILSLNPDIIYFGGLHTDAGKIVKYLKEYGSNTPFMGSDGIASPDFIQAAGGPKNVKDVYMTFLNSPLSSPESKKVVKKLEEKHIKPTGYMLNSYAAVQAIAAAIKNAPLDKMGEWLHQHTVDSVLGPLTWDQKGDLKKEIFMVYKWNDEGEYDPYWTP